MREPTVIIPYHGPDSTGQVEDVFLYLRPETNGVLVESTLMGVLRSSDEYRQNAQLIYLANLPGDFIMENHVIEEHYSINYSFACHGSSLFTPQMKSRFEKHYKAPFEHSKVLGAFEAMDHLDMGEEELFKLWVPFEDMLFLNGQSIKKIGEKYIVNYDIPALLHINNYSTDIAVMVLRSSLDHKSFNGMIRNMEKALIDKEIMDSDKPPSRYFHYSKSPFEQILDGLGYLYTPDGKHLPLENISFTVKLLENGYSLQQIQGIMKYPIMGFEENGVLIEDNVFIKSKNKTFDEALAILSKVKWQIFTGVRD